MKMPRIQVLISKMFPDITGQIYMEGYEKGHSTGRRDQFSEIIGELKTKSVNDFSADELKLGYSYAVAIVKEKQL
jgi:hypothetical protein